MPTTKPISNFKWVMDPRAKKLLLRVKAHILAEPNRFSMDDVVHKYAKEDIGTRQENCDGINFEVPKCGTTACIAGWTCILGDGLKGGFVEDADMQRAAELLGLEYPPDDYDYTDQLFLVQYWPEPFRSQWNAARTPKRRAKIAAALIDHFIANGPELNCP